MRMTTYICVLALVAAAASQLAFAGNGDNSVSINFQGKHLHGELVFQDDFEDMDEWDNLTPNTRWEVRDGELVGTWGPGGSTIWSKPAFSGDLYIRFTGRLLEPKDEWRTEKMPDGGKNFNFRFLVSGPDGVDIREVFRDLAEEGTGPNRTGDDQYEGYFFTWTWRHARLRRSPGYENVSENRDYLPQIGQTHTVEICKQGGRITQVCDGHLIHDYTDPDPFNSGRIGFTLWHSTLAVDSIEVFELATD
ncbi:MAG: family 16 glycoside hydrolase [Armatimonadota bacterium]